MKAFTKIELMVVLAILSLVIAMILGSIGKRHSVEVIDGCEYIVDRFGGNTPPVHKGNCTNIAHDSNQ